MSNLPLTGIRVLDLTQFYQGPYACFLMAKAGAEVIKIEPPGGERTRRGGGEDTPLVFAMLHANKQSLALDLRQQQGKEILKNLVKQADILVENFAPGTMERLEIGWDVLKEINPKLIYGSATGYGLSGPDHDQLAMDHTIQAVSGIMHMTGERGGPPARAGGQVCDFMGGIHLYAGIMTALFGRQQTGKGTHVEISMQETMYFSLSSEFSYLHRTGEVPERRGDKSAVNNSPYGRYECQDGWIALVCVSEQQWQNLARVIGREDLLSDPDYESGPKRVLHENEINQSIVTWCRDKTQEDAFRALRNIRIPVAQIRNITQIMGDAHMRARGMLDDYEHPYMGNVTLPNSPLRLSAYDQCDPAFFPEVGADSRQVLKEVLTMDDAAITRLKESAVIETTDT